MTTATATKEPKATSAAPDPDDSLADANGHANGHLTKADEYRREISSELAYARRDLREAHQEVVDLTADLKDAKDRMKAAQIRVNSLCESVIDIETGNYTPAMFDSNGAAKNGETGTRTDAGAAMPIAELKNFGKLTDKDIEKIANCPCTPKTIGEFEDWMKSDELWHRKIKGMAESGITKLQDAHVALRLQYPIPSEDDDELNDLDVDAGDDAGEDDGDGEDAED